MAMLAITLAAACNFLYRLGRAPSHSVRTTQPRVLTRAFPHSAGLASALLLPTASGS